MKYEDLIVGQIISAKKYNALATAKWRRDWNRAKLEGRSWDIMPQLAFYGFYDRDGNHRTDGFVQRTVNGSHWFGTMQEAVDYVDKVFMINCD